MPAKDIQMPARIARLPKDRRGYPVPYFVEEPLPGKEPDFRIMNVRNFAMCVKHKRCWICGEPLGANLAFVVGPMCCVNLISSEPPSHRECARYAAQVCPFLSIPAAKRREAGMPEPVIEPGGVMIKRNPGVTVVWMTKSYTLQKLPNGVIIHMGEPTAIEFWTQGRHATRPEVEQAVVTGFPTLLNMAVFEGPEAVAEVYRALRAFNARFDAVMPPAVAA